MFCSLGTFSAYQSLLLGFYLLSHVTSLLLKILLNPYLGENKHHSLQKINLYACYIVEQQTPCCLPLLLLLIVLRDATWVKNDVCSALDFQNFLAEKS